jgi:hypothetical protein
VSSTRWWIRSGSFLAAGASHRNSPPSFQIESQLRETAHNAVTKVNVKLEPKQKPMKAKHLSLAIAALLAAGGLWLARSAWRTHAVEKSNPVEMPRDRALTTEGVPDDLRRAGGPEADRENSRPPARKPGQMLRPPDPTRRFTDFTPEQRVEFARKGHGPGG